MFMKPPQKAETARLCNRGKPPLCELDLDGLERLGADDVVAAVRREHYPPSGVEPIHFERPHERIDEPEVRDPFSRIDAHLPSPVDPSRRRRDDLAGPVRRV